MTITRNVSGPGWGDVSELKHRQQQEVEAKKHERMLAVKQLDHDLVESSKSEESARKVQWALVVAIVVLGMLPPLWIVFSGGESTKAVNFLKVSSPLILAVLGFAAGRKSK